MKIELYKYVLYVHNNTFTKNFRKGFMTLKASKRNLLNYKIYGFHGELHDNYKGLCLEIF